MLSTNDGFLILLPRQAPQHLAQKSSTPTVYQNITCCNCAIRAMGDRAGFIIHFMR